MPNALLKDNKSETMLTTRQEKIKHNKLENVRETLNKINENLNHVLCVTRFNDETYREYQNFANIQACSKNMNTLENVQENVQENIYNVYNTPLPIAESKDFTNKYFIVMEMLNTNNTIRGISIIKNRPYYKKFKVYSDQNYNRHSYRIITRINRTDLLYLEPTLINNLEKLVFTQKNHLKRGQGIQMIQTNYYKKLQTISPIWESQDSATIERTILESLWSLIEKHKNTIWDEQMIEVCKNMNT